MKLSKMLSSLRTVLMLHVALPVLAMLGLILAVALTLVGNFMEERMQRDLQLVARTIHLPVSQALERQDLEQLQNSMASVFGMTEVYGAYLFDAEGQRLSSFGAVNPTQQQASRALELISEGEFAQYERIRGRNVYSFFMPLFDNTGQPSGLLQVTRLRSDIEKGLQQLRVWAWGGFLVIACLIMLVLMLTHQRAIGRPLSRLLSSIQQVREGHWRHRAALQGPSEVRELATGLNDMLDAIALAEQREAEQRRARSEMAERLRQTETLAALGQLSAGVAHELGAPLSVVDGRASRLLRVHQDSASQRELNEIRTQSSRMTAIIEQLLSYGRSSRARKRQLQVAALIARAQALLPEHAQTLELNQGENCVIEGDSLSLEQALVNLLRNAFQACPDGPVALGWSVDRQQKSVTIYVDDAGPGISEEMAAQVFEPFVTSKAPGEGSGLGLAIVRRVVRELDGDVCLAESQLGGARFELILPLKEILNNE